jgi:uncharacterized protein YjbI with pentapeptide repeats
LRLATSELPENSTAFTFVYLALGRSMAHNPPRREERQVDQDPKPGKRSIMRELVPDWRPSRRQVLWTIRIVLVLVVVLSLLTLAGWPFDVTLWDWLDLLIVPAVLAVGGYLFTRSENRRTLEDADRQRSLDRETAEQRTIEDRKIAQERAETDRQIANQRRQDDTLQAYLDQIGQLLLDKDTPLRTSKEDSEARTLARARTLTVLPRLDGSRKGSVLQFLHESGLITKGRVIVDPGGADLSGANLSEANLSSSDLRGADLRQTDLSSANLSGANLSHAILDGANLSSRANLSGADLSRATLSRANLSSALLPKANLSHAILDGANLSSRANLSGADLPGATLSGADLSRALLSRANLSGADLSNANLSRANLSHANLSRAILLGADLPSALLPRELTEEQLDQAPSLKGATMPDGRVLKDVTAPDGPTFEEWLKSKGRGEDG